MNGSRFELEKVKFLEEAFPLYKLGITPEAAERTLEKNGFSIKAASDYYTKKERVYMGIDSPIINDEETSFFVLRHGDGEPETRCPDYAQCVYLTAKEALTREYSGEPEPDEEVSLISGNIGPEWTKKLMADLLRSHEVPEASVASLLSLPGPEFMSLVLAASFSASSLAFSAVDEGKGEFNESYSNFLCREAVKQLSYVGASCGEPEQGNLFECYTPKS